MRSFVLFALILALPAFAAPAATKIELTTGSTKSKDDMVYSKDRLTAKAGSRVSISFKNAASSTSEDWPL